MSEHNTLESRGMGITNVRGWSLGVEPRLTAEVLVETSEVEELEEEENEGKPSEMVGRVVPLQTSNLRVEREHARRSCESAVGLR